MTEQPAANNAMESVLADLRARRAKLDAAIAAIEDLMGIQVSGSFATAPASTSGDGWANGQIPSDAFFGLSIPDGTRKYLRAVRRKASAAEIARALEQGGMTHQSKYF